MVGTAVFAVTGVLAVTRRGLDIFGAVVLGIVTSLGGGTVRDLMIDAPVFWFQDTNYLWVALAASLAAFWIGGLFRKTSRALLYLDGLGAALFAVTAVNKALLLQFAAPVAVIMGLLTGIGGGLVRDVMAGRPTLLMSRELYATPILLGCILFVIVNPWTPGASWPATAGVALIFGMRSLAIYKHLEMPSSLTFRGD